MGDVKEKFILDWQTVFPGVAVPDISYFANNETIEKEIILCQERIDDLKFKLEKEQFVLSKLKSAKKEVKPKNFSEDEDNIVKTDDEDEVISTESVWASVPKLMTPQSSFAEDDLILPPPPSFEELNNDEINKQSVWEFKNKNTTAIMKLEDNSNKAPETLQPGLSTFQPSARDSRSSSKTSLNEMFDTSSSSLDSTEPFEKFSNIKTHKKSYSIDENVFDYASPIPVARRLTDPLPTSKTKDNSGVKPKTAPRTLTRSKKDKPLPPLPRKPLRSERNSTKDNVFIPAPPSSPPPALPSPAPTPERTISQVSSIYDDEHIYTDISELNINVKREQVDESCSESEDSYDEVIYENSQMQPKIEPLVDNSSDSLTEEKSEKPRQLKRSGSHDRQAIALPDDMVIVDVASGPVAGASLEEILNGSKESLVDDLEESTPKQPVIVVVEENEEDSSDDEEHIYANVEDLILNRISDDDSDHDPMADSISMGLPSPHYKEMTSDQIQSMLQKIQNNAHSDHSHDESSDSEESQTPRVKDLKKRITSSSEIKRSPKVKEGSLGRTASTPLPHAIPEKPNQTPEELEEEHQHLKASRMRKLLVNNLLDSEKAYMDCLEMLTKFMKPLKISTESSQPILSTADFKHIFHKAEELLELHSDFYNQLEPRIASWNDAQLIGDLFTLIMHSFDLYLGYIGNYKVAMETILKCRQANQQFSSIMDQDIKIISLKDPLKLDGLLYKPVDRMTQYSLILNDLLKYTSPDHPDHVLIVEVSGALFDLFEQVNVDSSKKKRRQRQLLKELAVVEIDDGERRPRSLILFNDVIICAKLKPSGDAYVGKWYASLSDIDLKPYPNSESTPIVPVSSKTECDKIRANIANMRQELRREHMPLQQVVSSSDASPPFMKRRNGPGVRASSRGLEKIKKKIGEQEKLLHLISPSIPLNIYHKNGKCYTLLLAVEAERQAWFEALKPRLKRIHARSPPSIILSSLELQQAFETVLKCQRLGQRFGSQMPSPFLGPTRPMSMDFSMFDDDKESLTGFLFVSLHYGKGFAKNSDTYVILEMDSYGHFFKKAKTKPCRGSDPSWEEAFEFEIEACNTLKLTCFNKLRLMGDDISGKCTINLTREKLTDNRNHTLSVSLDRGQSILNISLCFSTSIDGIKKSPSFSDTGVFGVPIQVVCKREKFDIPVIVLSCIKEIEKRGMDEIGIYRLSGVASEIQQLKKLFNEQTQNALLVLADTDIHAVAGLLKLYLRELPQSLFTSKLYRKFVQGLSITDSEEKELYMVEVLHQLPKPNKITTLYLFDHLRRVTLLEETNKMGTNNLATVFGPTVLRPPSSNSDKENETSSCNVGTFDIGALDVMSQVGIFRYFLGLKNNERTKLPADDLELWRRLDPEKATKMEEDLMITAEEHLI